MSLSWSSSNGPCLVYGGTTTLLARLRSKLASANPRLDSDQGKHTTGRHRKKETKPILTKSLRSPSGELPTRVGFEAGELVGIDEWTGKRLSCSVAGAKGIDHSRWSEITSDSRHSKAPKDNHLRLLVRVPPA